MQNEGKTDNKKTMITFLSDDFSAPCESRISLVKSTNHNMVYLLMWFDLGLTHQIRKVELSLV